MIATMPELAQTLFEEAGDALFLFDPDTGRIVDVNPTAQRFCGVGRPTLLKEAVDTLFRSEQAGGVRRLQRAYRTTGQFHAQDGYFLRQRAGGTWLPVNLTVARLHARPKVLGLITARDVSERQRADRALREGEARYRSVVETSADGIFVNKGGRIVFANPALMRLLGATCPEQVVGKTPFELIHPDYHAAVRERIRIIQATGQPVPFFEETYVRCDGTLVEVEIAAAPFTDQGETAILVTSRDISDRKRAERAVRASEERFRALIEKSFDGLLMIDRDGVILYASPSATRIMGYAADEFVGRHFSAFVSPEDLDEHVERHRRLIAAPGASVPSCNRYRHKDGGWRWLEVRSTNLLAEPSVRAKVVNFRDVSEQRQLEEQYRQAQKMEAVGQLAGGVAHDFNNLLTIINGYTDVLLQTVPETDPSRDALEQVRRAGERSAGLTRQLLAFSRQQVLAPRVLDLNVVVADTEKMLRRVIGEDVVLATTLDAALGTVRADPGQVEQILLNLVVNARDAMPTGGRLTIETRNVELPDGPSPPGAYVQLAVTDTGCGMSPEVRDRIFEPFFTTKGPGKGTGLGLATVWGIVRQSGGHVDVESAVGAGTTVRVSLPRVGGPEATGKSRSGVVAPPRGTETVLLVEDEPGVRALTRFVLSGCGYTVLEAADGDEAIELAAAHAASIDLLVSDVVMPGSGGRQVADRLAQQHPRLKVLYVSGYTDDAVLRHGVLQNGVNFLQKPFSPVALAHTVRKILDAVSGRGVGGPADGSRA